MSDHKKPTKLRVAPSNAVAMIDALMQSLGYAPAVSKAQRSLLKARGTAVPDDVIELLVNLAEQHGGEIAGVPFDARAARECLARAKHARDVAKAARRLSMRAVSDALQNLALVGDEAMGMVLMLDRKVRSPKALAFKEANDQIRASMRKQGRSRKVAQKKAASTTSPTNPPHNGVSNGTVVKPAAPLPAQPS